jgi:guanylate kinase
MKTKGSLFIVSAPSGAGKTSLVKRLQQEVDGLEVSVSHTTRDQRPGEADGVDYCFVEHKKFEEMLEKGAFLEQAQVFDNFYGTAQESVEKLIAEGSDVILEIDWQGAEQVRNKLPEAVSLFVLPPSRKALEERLKGRGQDSDEIISRRMRDAIAEMSHYAEYDYLIINDNFELALQEMKAIITAQRLQVSRQSIAVSQTLVQLLAEE